MGVTAARAAEARPECDAVEAAAPEAVLPLPLLGPDGGRVVAQNVAYEYCGHDAVTLGTHIRAGDAVDIEYGDIETIVYLPIVAARGEDAAADGVVLVFERAVDTAVLGVEGEAAEVSHESRDRAHDAALHVGLDQHRRIGVVYVPVFGVDGYALNMSRGECSRVDKPRKLCRRYGFGCGGRQCEKCE